MGKFERLEAAAAKWLAEGKIESIDQLDATAVDLLDEHLARRQTEFEQQVDEIEQKVRRGLEQLDRGEYVAFNSTEDAVEYFAQRYKDRHRS